MQLYKCRLSASMLTIVDLSLDPEIHARLARIHCNAQYRECKQGCSEKLQRCQMERERHADLIDKASTEDEKIALRKQARNFRCGYLFGKCRSGVTCSKLDCKQIRRNCHLDLTRCHRKRFSLEKQLDAETNLDDKLILAHRLSRLNCQKHLHDCTAFANK